MNTSGNGHDAPETLSAEQAQRNLQAESIGRSLLIELVDIIKMLPEPWAKTSEDDQNDIIDRLRDEVHAMARRTVVEVEARGRPHLRSTVDQVVFKDGVRIVLKGLSGAAAHDLADAQGSDVLVVIGDAAPFIEGTEAVRGDPDQQPLPDLEPAADTVADPVA